MNEFKDIHTVEEYKQAILERSIILVKEQGSC